MTDTEYIHAYEGKFSKVEPMTTDFLLSEHPEHLEPSDWFDTYRQPKNKENV